MISMNNKIKTHMIFIKEKIKDNIFKILQSNPRVYCLQRVIRSINDSDYREQIMKFNHDPDILRIHRLGTQNKEKNIYYINVGNASMGFGACFRYVLYGLFSAKQLGFTPVVRLSQECPYQEKEPMMGTDNPFEYYFKQVSDITVVEALASNRVFIHNDNYISQIEKDLGNPAPELGTGYIVDEAYLQELANLVKEYISLNEYTEKYINNSMEKLISEDWDTAKVLGIQVRGTDYALNWNGHPNMVQAADYFAEIDDVLNKYGFRYIFLATDDQNRLIEFKNRYGNQLVYYDDVHRGTGQINISLESNSRVKNAYLNGLEVIRDMYTLSRCDGFIAGLSQVSILTRVLRLSYGKQFEYLKVLDKGIYSK